ncbi:MAG: metal ABC transporter permease [Planctomycetota bacterium]
MTVPGVLSTSLPTALPVAALPSLGDANLQWALMGTCLLGLISGMLGTFALLRKEALLGDALAHAALPGVCIAFLLTESKQSWVLLLGALATGLLGTVCVRAIVKYSRLKSDAALAIVLSLFFGAGIVLLTYLQGHPSGRQAGLDHLLFGQAAALLSSDVKLMAWLAAGLTAVVFLLYKELKIVTFDAAYARSIGVPAGVFQALLTGMIVLAVVVGLQAVGIVLMAAMLVTPAAAARYWTDRLSRMLWISGGIGALSGVGGAYLSALAPGIPTGPVIVLLATVGFLISLIFAPQRGVISRLRQVQQNRKRVLRENVLKTLFLLDERRTDGATGGTASEVAKARGARPAAIARELDRLARAALVEPADESRFRLTGTGQAEARRVVRNHRLWEMYLVSRADIAIDHVHRDADAIEHLLPPDLVAALEHELRDPTADPHGSPIPKLDGETTPAGGAA